MLCSSSAGRQNGRGPRLLLLQLHASSCMPEVQERIYVRQYRYVSHRVRAHRRPQALGRQHDTL